LVYTKEAKELYYELHQAASSDDEDEDGEGDEDEEEFEEEAKKKNIRKRLVKQN